MPAALDDYHWLISDAAQPWLTRVREELSVCDPGGIGPGGCGPRSGPQQQRVTPALLQRIRKDLSTDRTHLVVEQVELRERAREKFSRADRMFFTRKGLEQATDEVLAKHKATRFPAESTILDLCCGIGGDLLALSGREAVRTIGVDREVVCEYLAAANARACGFTSEVCLTFCTDVSRMPIQPAHYWHCDPDRRIDDQRTTQLELFEPSLDALDRLRGINPNAAIKLAPATQVPPHWWDLCEREWLGSRGECRQQVAWFGSLARHPGRHAATVVAADGSSRNVVGSYSEPVPVARQLGRYLYEPHAAVLAASLTGAVCREQGLAAVAAGVAYLTGDRLIADAALAAFEVQEVLPFDRKQLRGWCREHSIGRLEIKKRGVKLDPRQLRAEIIAAGDNEATLIVTPLGGHVRAIVARRVTPLL
jgi:hypothetical protein